MSDISRFIARAEGRPRESFDDPSRGAVTWFTLFSGDITPTQGLTAGIADVLREDGRLALHRHAQPELYYILAGTGVLTIDGVERAVTAGDAVFIPGDAEHGLRNESDAPLRLLYVFPTDRFSDVVYRFAGDAEAPAGARS